MLTIFSGSNKGAFCDGVSRRNFIRIGALGLGGLALPQLLQAETQSGIRRSHKAVIMIYLPGGPPHQDTFDLKLEAPSEIRGEFRPIPTNVAGLQICEHLPKIARVCDKLAVIRSIADAVDDHSDFMCMTARRKQNQPPGGWPTFGAMVSKLMGSTDAGVPSFVGLEPRMQHRPYNAASPGFLGPGHNSFRPEAEGKSDMVLNGVTLDRLADRKTLLTSFDRFRREVDTSGLMDGMDTFNRQAFGVLTSSRLLEALDVQREDARTRERNDVAKVCGGERRAGRTQHARIGARLPGAQHDHLADLEFTNAGHLAASIEPGPVPWKQRHGSRSVAFVNNMYYSYSRKEYQIKRTLN